MNIRQRKLQILREMKALKRKYNRLSRSQSNLRRRSLNETQDEFLYSILPEVKRIASSYLKLGKMHFEYEWNKFDDDINREQLAKVVSKNIWDALNEYAYDNDLRSSYFEYVVYYYLLPLRENRDSYLLYEFVYDNIYNYAESMGYQAQGN